MVIDVEALARIKEELCKDDKIEKLMEQFMHENPYGDSRELAAFMYEKGLQDGYSRCILYL